jgi:hypothetical protein
VQIPNGTAAVSAEGLLLAKVGHWATGKAEQTRRHFAIRASQKTCLKRRLSPSLAFLAVTRVQKNGCINFALMQPLFFRVLPHSIRSLNIVIVSPLQGKRRTESSPARRFAFL